jgi:hypothetical protein
MTEGETLPARPIACSACTDDREDFGGNLLICINCDTALVPPRVAMRRIAQYDGVGPRA